MKKIIAILFILVLIITVSGCKNLETTKTTGDAAKESTELDKDLNDLDNMSNDLNTSDLDNLDKDLQNVNW